MPSLANAGEGFFVGKFNNKQIKVKYKVFYGIFRAIILSLHKLLAINDLRRAAQHKPLIINNLQLSAKKVDFFLAILSKWAYCTCMISIKKNDSFPSWIQVFAFGQFIDEVKGQAKALRIATKIAKDNKVTHVNVFGKAEKIEN
tara:strand:+ start:119 stop:550 length:432 start_codon:yes stop_codon:yes gene_type:complete